MAKSLLQTKTKKRTPVLARGHDKTHMGDEPAWTNTQFLNEEELKSAFLKALNWYRYFFEVKESRSWLVDYMEKAGMSKAAIRMLGNVPDIRLTNSICATARMILMGYPATPNDIERLNNKIVDLIKMGIDSSKETSSVIKSLKNPVSDLIGEFEGMLDDNSESLTNVYQWLKNHEIKPIHATALANFYKPVLQELEEVYSTKDEDLKFAYRHMTKRALKARITLYKCIIDDAESYASNKRKTVTRKPRKQKVKSASTLVAKLKYQKENADLKIASIDPTKIIGSKELWVFNTKYNTLTRYISVDGFTVKGTTLQNIDSASKVKKVRKPGDVLSNILQGTAKSAEKIFNALKTKENEANGRLSEHSILLRIFR